MNDLQILKSRMEVFEKKIDAYKNQSLSLDMTRGKPSPLQLDLSNDMELALSGSFSSDDGVDTRNYGGLDGLPKAKELFSNLLQVQPNNVLVGGNSSLQLMYQYASFCFHHGPDGEGSTAWRKNAAADSTPSFLCPVPGYDRHFAICEYLGIKMIPIAMTEDGPDINQVEDLIASDPSIRGMWCVPKYSNPSGIVYSSETIKRIATLGKIAHPTFRVFWDNAYSIHDLYKTIEILPVLEYAEEQGTEDCVIVFGSTSKISFAGSGIACLGASSRNLDSFKHHLSIQTIGPDKVNQLRHVQFFKNFPGLCEHMTAHANILRPKFEIVIKTLEEEIGDLKIASWTTPLGGYFISLDTIPGLAKKVVALCSELGVKLTPAGSTFPYGKDPEDKNIRIAPSFPKLTDLQIATQVLAACLGYLSCKAELEKA